MLNKFNKPIRVAIYASIALTMSFSHLFAGSSISIGMQQEPTSLDPPQTRLHPLTECCLTMFMNPSLL